MRRDAARDLIDGACQQALGRWQLTILYSLGDIWYYFHCKYFFSRRCIPSNWYFPSKWYFTSTWNFPIKMIFLRKNISPTKIMFPLNMVFPLKMHGCSTSLQTHFWPNHTSLPKTIRITFHFEVSITTPSTLEFLSKYNYPFELFPINMILPIPEKIVYIKHICPLKTLCSHKNFSALPDVCHKWHFQACSFVHLVAVWTAESALSRCAKYQVWLHYFSHKTN